MSMVRFEWNKLLRDRRNRIVMLVGYLVLFIVACHYGVQTYRGLGGIQVMQELSQIQKMSAYLLIIVILCVAPMISREYESGAVDLLCMTRYGNSKWITAKLVVALLFAESYLLIGFLLGMTVLSLWTGGYAGSAWPLLVILWKEMKSLLMAFAFTTGTLLLSETAKSSVGTVAIMLLLYYFAGEYLVPMNRAFGDFLGCPVDISTFFYIGVGIVAIVLLKKKEN